MKAIAKPQNLWEYISSSFQIPPRKYFLFPPAWKVPKWIEDMRPRGIARFVSFTFVIRRSDYVEVYPIGINTGMIIKVPKGTHIHGGPTVLYTKFMIGTDIAAIRIYFEDENGSKLS